jgi:uncharacterized protein with NRDE domain
VCTLAVYLGTFPRHPVVVAANRDEFLDRPATPPVVLRAEPPVAVGGRDLVADGTWLGVNAAGLVAGMLNRRTGTPPDPACRSRGLLCLDLLRARTIEEAEALVAREPAGRYNAFNALVACGGRAFVASQPPGEAPRIVRLDPGLHLLTNLDLNDPTCPRIAASHAHFAAAAEAGADDPPEALVARLRPILADHTTALDPRGPGSLCLHYDEYGTRSSSIVFVPPDARGIRLFHADGPPCRIAHAPIPLPF